MMEVFEFKRAAFDRPMLENYARLFSLCFPRSSKLTVEYLHWLYTLCPDGYAVGYDAFADGRLVAHYVVVPVCFASAEGSVIRGCWSLNTATHPEYQRKGLFVKLAEATYAAAHSEGSNFVVGVANNNSTPGLVRRLGFLNVGQLSTEIGYFRSHLVRQSSGWMRRWNGASMSWRLKNPSAKYEVHWHGQSVTVYRPFLNGLVNIDLGDLPSDWFERSSQAVMRRALPAIRVSFGRQSRGVFVNISKRLLPSPWNVIWRQLSPEQTFSPTEIRMVGLDLDSF